MPRTSLVDKYGKWALITGASSGIGEAFAKELASNNLNIVLTARREEKLRSLANTLQGLHSIETRVVVADLSDPSAYQSILEAVSDIDIGMFICNAGIEVHGSFFHNSCQAHLDLLNINIYSATALTYRLVRKMTDRKTGAVIILSSFLRKPFAWFATYSASKAYLSSFGIILREEVKKYGIDVLICEPGSIKSELVDQLTETLSLRKLMMPTASSEKCAKEAIWALQRGKATWTTGLTYRMLQLVTCFLPRTWRVRISSFLIRRVMNPECLKFG